LHNINATAYMCINSVRLTELPSESKHLLYQLTFLNAPRRRVKRVRRRGRWDSRSSTHCQQE